LAPSIRFENGVFNESDQFSNFSKTALIKMQSDW